MLVEGDRTRLTERGYEQLRSATRTHREELVLRLCGEAGLRAGETARLRPNDVTGRDDGTSAEHFVAVREADGNSRTACLPADVAHDFWQYVHSNAVAADEEVIGVSERRVQMLIQEVCERAARKTGRTGLEAVTPSILRQFFAQQLLVKDGVDARVVREIGGWEGVDTVLAPLERPSKAEIGRTFERLEGDDSPSGQLTAVVETLDRTISGILGRNSRAELEQQLCEGLADQRYSAAWVLRTDANRDRVVVQAHAGESPERFDGAGNTDPVRQTLETGEIIVTPDEPGPASEQEGVGQLAAIPLEDGETQYGSLVVRARQESAFEGYEQTALSMLGRQVGFAITATERRQVLAGGSVLEVQFRYDDETALVALWNAVRCPIALDGAVASGEGFLCFLRVSGVSAKAALEAATEIPHIGGARLIRSEDEGGLIEVSLTSDSPLFILTQRGATVSAVTVEDGAARLTCELSPDADLRSVHNELQNRFPSVELRSKQETQTTETSPRTRDPFEAELTEKQRAVLRTAYHAGYFEWPRESTAEDLAESMGISSPTLHNHLRKAQQTLLDRILEPDSK